MKNLWLCTAILVACPHCSWAIYGPSLARTDVSVSSQACQEAGFSQGEDIRKALEDGRPDEILRVLGSALAEWRATPTTSALYVARAFCVHELVPSQLPPGDQDASPSVLQPTDAVRKFHNLGIEYFYYSPDGAWTLRQDPVDLNQLATGYLGSRWGREAFLMMTEIGWSKGSCQEGPDQFREVIRRGETFLRDYPDSEVSESVRLKLANAYATWWNVSRMKPDGYADPETYKPGALEAKQRAIELYQDHLKSQKLPSQEVLKRLKALQENPQGSETYDYFCEDYED